MKDFRDMKPMKRSGHEFLADGGFTGSSMPEGSSKVKSYIRKPPTGKPTKANFKRRAVLPGGMATGGLARPTSTEVTLASGKYASGGKAKHSDVAADRALIRAELSKRGLACGGKATYGRTPVVKK